MIKNIRKGFRSNIFSVTGPGKSNERSATLITATKDKHSMISELQSMFERIRVPVTFDLLADFDLNNPEHQDVLKKNKFILDATIGNTHASKAHELRKFLKVNTRVIHMYNLLENYCKRCKQANLTIFTDNYDSGKSIIEQEVSPGVVERLDTVRAETYQQIAEQAFRHATLNGRGSVTLVHGVDDNKIIDELFLSTCKEVAKNYPYIKCDEVVVDDFISRYRKHPNAFRFVIMPNFYQNILLTLGLVDDTGYKMIVGANIGEDHLLFDQGFTPGNILEIDYECRFGAVILASVSMLRSMDLPNHADRIYEACHSLYDHERRDFQNKEYVTNENFMPLLIKNL